MKNSWDLTAVRQWVWELGRETDEDREFLDALTEELVKQPEIAKEFAFYMETGNFLCDAKIEGYTVIDIMVWQMDYFKTELDRDRYDMKNNRGKMILRAFDTMIKMQKDPLKYKGLMQSQTGTDYPDKF